MKDYNFKQTELSSLRMLLDFGKFNNQELVNLAFNILCLEPKGKAAYITKAVNHYDEVKGNSTFSRLIFDIKQLDLIKKQHNICDVESLKELLETDRKGPIYNFILKKIPETKDSTRMLCGFSKEDKKASEMHERLFKMSVNDRINLISQAVVRYVYDGYDPRARAILAHSFLKQMIDDYQEADDETKKIMLDDIFSIMEISTRIQPIYKADIKLDSLSKEVLTLFIDEDEIKEFLE